MGLKVYLDSSAIIKRYVLEEGSGIVRETYLEALNGFEEPPKSTYKITQKNERILRAKKPYLNSILITNK